MRRTQTSQRESNVRTQRRLPSASQRETPEETKPADTLILDFWPPELGDSFCCSRATIWHSVQAVSRPCTVVLTKIRDSPVCSLGSMATGKSSSSSKCPPICLNQHGCNRMLHTKGLTYLFLIVLKAVPFQDPDTSMVSSGEGSLPGLQTATFSVSLHGKVKYLSSV